jgi:hypothetical protein
MTAVGDVCLAQLRYEQHVLYSSYQELLKSGTHEQLSAKALEVIHAREATNRKITTKNSDIAALVGLKIPPSVLPALMMDYDFEGKAIAMGLHAEHVPRCYKERGAIATLSARQEQALAFGSPFTALDDTTECAFRGIPKVAYDTDTPVTKQLKLEEMSDKRVMEEIERGLLNGSVVIVLSRALVDRHFPEVLLEETGRAVCWDIFRKEARRVPKDVGDPRLILRVIGSGKLLLFTSDSMTVLGGFVKGGGFVLGTFRAAVPGEPERDFVLNCYRDGALCRVYYAKAPRGALKVSEFFQDKLRVDITPLREGAFYNLHG